MSKTKIIGDLDAEFPDWNWDGPDVEWPPAHMDALAVAMLEPLSETIEELLERAYLQGARAGLEIGLKELWRDGDEILIGNSALTLEIGDE